MRRCCGSTQTGGGTSSSIDSGAVPSFDFVTIISLNATLRIEFASPEDFLYPGAKDVFADAVAEARRASAEWSRAQARSYSSKKSRNEDAPQSPSRRGDATEYLVRNTEAYAPLPSAPPPSPRRTSPCSVFLRSPTRTCSRFWTTTSFSIQQHSISRSMEHTPKP